MSASYCYTPLDENAKQIRLLTLLPLAFPSITHSPAVHISLELVQLTQENVPQFEALSYAWGSPEDPVEILIETETGSQALKVTQNLYEALHHLRLENQPRVLWIDAICINQQDIPERSTQVKRMADIYTLSKRVVVWLGPEVDDSSLALDLLESLGSKIEVDWPRWRMNATSEEPSEQHWADRYQSLPYNDRELTAIVRLCELPWFERLWIWQEIWLAGPSAILVCGRKTLLWEIFRKACFCTINKARWITVSRARCELLDHLCCKSPYQPFSSLAIDTQLAKCSDPRDRIFAMRSLVRPEDPVAKIEPDYAKGVFEVYRETFLTCSSQHESLLLMSRCELAQRAVDIPTWLPNWTVPQRGTFISQTSASGVSAAVFELKEERVLRVCGITLDIVGSVARHSTEVWKNLGSEIHKIAHHFSVSDNQLEAFCHALVVGCFDHYSYPQTAAMEETPNLVDSIECVSSITRTGNFNIDDLPLSQHKFINRVAEATRDRSVYKTAGGKFGTAPICIEPGDIVVALFGFDTAMILRRADGNTYEVVGQTYCYGYMSCEGFLGLLPNTHRMVWIHDPRDVGLRRAYLHKESGVLEVEDPRLGPLLNGWEIIDHDAQHLHHRFTNKETRETTDFDPRLTPEALLERGVDIQYFDLV